MEGLFCVAVPVVVVFLLVMVLSAMSPRQQRDFGRGCLLGLLFGGVS